MIEIENNHTGLWVEKTRSGGPRIVAKVDGEEVFFAEPRIEDAGPAIRAGIGVFVRQAWEEDLFGEENGDPEGFQ